MKRPENSAAVRIMRIRSCCLDFCYSCNGRLGQKSWYRNGKVFCSAKCAADWHRVMQTAETDRIAQE